MAHTATLKALKPQSKSPATGERPLSAVPYLFAMKTDPGRIRHTNQDACAALAEQGAFVVCDGVGGAAAGEVASHLATESFMNNLAHSGRPHRTQKATAAGSEDPGAELYPANHPHSRLRQAVLAANHAVFQRAQKSRSLRGMATTLVGLLWKQPDSHSDRTLWLAHVGDSRCYRFRGGRLELLTRDHSLVEEQVRAGLISRMQAEMSPVRNVITRAVGSQASVEPEIAAHTAEAGDLFVLTSDGLTRELDDAAIAHILSHATATTLEHACQDLIDAANRSGGRDNITVLLIAITA